MRRFRRNSSLADVIQSHPTAGLPLFSQKRPSPLPPGRGAGGEALTEKQQALVDNAPLSIEHATPTRDLAHDIITFNPRILAQKQADVFNAIRSLSAKYGDATNQEVADWIPRSVNRIVGRTFELREMRYIVPSQRRACRSTGEVVQAWKVNPNMSDPSSKPNSSRQS